MTYQDAKDALIPELLLFIDDYETWSDDDKD